MKIAFIINALSDGGAERVVQTLSEHFTKSGLKVYIILLDNSTQHYKINENVKIIVLKTSILNKSFGKIISIPLQSVELYFLLKKLKIESTISFLVRSNLVFSFMKFFSKRKVIISERSFASKHYEEKKLKNYIMNYLIQTLYKKANLIVTISNGIKESLIENYQLERNKIKTIYNPQNISFIKNYKIKKTGFKFDKNKKYFITLGRLIKLKDHSTMIKAFHKVNSKNPNTNLIILGEGPLRKELTQLIKELGLENKVHLLGFQKDPFSYLKHADIFVFSSKFEGFGNVIVEAMACGLPVISTDCPSGPSEILDNGRFGKLVKVGDVEELSNAMIEMLKDENISKYKQLSLSRADDFDVDKIAKQYLDVMEQK